ncbi:MAG TPA: PAS domain-containing sensor histidine kinase, partial [Vicinamibacterales bacterium]|nr:PAS domain-containing sensor histidine kinase [Vicinamibacterales bacterium]
MDRLPRLTIAVPLIGALLLALASTFAQGSLLSLAAAAAGALVIVAIYAVPWDRLPRWVHDLPVFGGVAAVFIIQATVNASNYGVAPVLLVFPLYLTTVLFAALYLTRNEVWAATALASIGVVALAISGRNQPGQPAISILVIAVLWVVVLTVHVVVTERKRVDAAVSASNAALTESEARLQAIIDTSLTAIVTMDEHGAIAGWNPQAESTFGWPGKDVIGKLLVDTIVPQQHRAAHRAGLARYLATGEGPVLGKVLELTAIGKDGREFPIELAISLASAPGAPPLFVGFVRDVTARKQADDAIQTLNRELQVANLHKSEFLANMSHELRTPLNAILGFSELMLDDMSDKYDATTRQKFLSQINSSGKHLLSLINDILDLSKVEAGQMELRLQAVSVAESVDQVVRTVEPLVTKKSLTLTANVSGVGDVLADAGKLKQMLLNLLSNAIKFTPEGGTVTIAGLRLKDTVEISVADTGIGIADADQKQIFKEFHQVDHGPGRKHEGTGLGLALTRRFALLHGGDVRVTSRVNKGSVFTLSLPVRASVLPAPEPAHVVVTNGQ